MKDFLLIMACILPGNLVLTYFAPDLGLGIYILIGVLMFGGGMTYKALS